MTVPADAFRDPSKPPDARQLAALLGPADRLWRLFTGELRAAWAPLADEWSFSKALGWTLRLKQPKRVLVYVTPERSRFLASVVLGEKACKTIADAGVPAAILALIEAAPKYAEGRGVRIPVRTKADVDAVLKIVAIKASTSK
jgi:hypothetical protein